MNEIEWEREKERKQCHLIIQNCTNAEKFQYHCLPDKFIDTFVEVCAPILQTVGKNIFFPFFKVKDSIVYTLNIQSLSVICKKKVIL